MRALLLQALHRLLETHLAMPPALTLLTKNIASKFKFDITYSKLARLPLSELKNALKVPCPTPPAHDNNAHIALFKRLRHNLQVEESTVCMRCTRDCPFRAVAFKDMPVKPETTNKSALNDLLYFLIALSQHQ